MEDHQEEGHLIKTHLEDGHLILLLDFMDGKYLILGYLCHHGINQFQFNLNQPINCHIRSFNIPHVWRILIVMFTLRFSKKQSKPMVRSWRWILSTCLVLLYEITSQSGVKILYKIILIIHLWSRASILQALLDYEEWQRSLYEVEESLTTNC